MGLTEIGWEDVDKIHLAQHRVQWKAVVKPTINRRFPIKKYLTRYATVILTSIEGVWSMDLRTESQLTLK
jgi:hypothetical protein